MTAPTAPPGPAGPAASARYRDVFGVPEFRTLFGLQTLQVTGDSVRMIALSVQAYERTGSALAAALVFCAGMLPYAVGGALRDDSRRPLGRNRFAFLPIANLLSFLALTRFLDAKRYPLRSKTL